MTSAIDLCGTQMSADTNGWMDGWDRHIKESPKGRKRGLTAKELGVNVMGFHFPVAAHAGSFFWIDTIQHFR